MTHFASYWKLFDKPTEPIRVTGWRTRRQSRLADAVKGDILWLFTSGRKWRAKAKEDPLPDTGVDENQAYLVEVFTIYMVVPKTSGPFELLVKGLPDKCVSLSPPIAIDEIVRPDGWGKDKPIGSLRQGAWRLPDHIADLLEEKLNRDSPDAYRQVFGCTTTVGEYARES